MSCKNRLKSLSGTAKALLLAVTLIFPLGVAAPALAGSATWQSSNIQYLYGSGYELDPHTHSVITVEHADGWKYGDNFFFLDVINGEQQTDDHNTSLYSEFSPRLSLGKISGKDLSFGPVKDVLLAGTLEMGQGFHNYLYGLGVDLAIPKFAFFQLNAYVRDNPSQSGVTYQFTPCWALPFNAGPVKMLFEGFADIAGSEGDLAFNIDTQPRLLVDLGNFWGAPDSVYAGTEVQIWHNKYGVSGVNEFVPQAMVKWVF